MSWYYDFYKLYKTRPEDVEKWSHKRSDELPDHLQFFCKEYDNSDHKNEIEEIRESVMFSKSTEFERIRGERDIPPWNERILLLFKNRRPYIPHFYIPHDRKRGFGMYCKNAEYIRMYWKQAGGMYPEKLRGKKEPSPIPAGKKNRPRFPLKKRVEWLIINRNGGGYERDR